MEHIQLGDPLTVFISARVQEMAAERLAAGAVVASMHLRPVLFEHLRPLETERPVYLEAARTCDVFVGIYGNEYGDPIGDRPSPIEQEFLAALEAPLMPRLLLIRRSRSRQRRLQGFLQRATPQSTLLHYSDYEDMSARLKRGMNALLAAGFRDVHSLVTDFGLAQSWDRPPSPTATPLNGTATGQGAPVQFTSE